MKLRIILVCFFAAWGCGHTQAYALDWKHLHEQADTMSYASAQARVAAQGSTSADRYLLALVCLNEYKDAQAREIFAQLAAQDAEACEYQWGMAEILRREHQLDKSGQMLARAIGSNPDFAPACISLAYVRFNQLAFDQTVALALKVVRLGRQKVDTSNLVRAYLLAGGAKGMIANYGGAISKIINGPSIMPYLKKAEKLQPENPGVAFGFGCFYLLAPRIAGGDTAKAVVYLEKAVKADPLCADAYARLAQAYYAKGKVAEYRACLQKALALDPGNVLALDTQSGACKFMCKSMER